MSPKQVPVPRVTQKKKNDAKKNYRTRRVTQFNYIGQRELFSATE